MKKGALGNIFIADFYVVWMGKFNWSGNMTFSPLQAVPQFMYTEVGPL